MRKLQPTTTAVLLALGGPALAQDAPPPAIPQGAVQPADDDVLHFEPADEGESSNAEAVAHFMAGQVLERRRDVVGALEEYERAVAIDGGSFRLLSSYVPLAYLLGKSDEAEAKALSAAASSPRGHELARALAAVMANGGKTDDAERLLRRTLEVDRVRDDRLVRLLTTRDLGAVLQATGDSAEAAALFEKVFAALEAGDPPLTAEEEAALLADAGETYETFGEAFLAAEKPELAVRAFGRAADARGGNPAVHSFNLATVFRETGQPAKALEELDKYLAAQLQSKGEAAYDMLAELYEELGRGDDLLPRLAELVEKDRRNPTLRFYYADRLLEAGDLTAASEQYRVGLGGGRDLRGLTGLMAVARREQDGERLYDLLLKAFPIVAQQGGPEGRFGEEWEAAKADDDLIDGVAAAARERLADAERPMELLPIYVTSKLLAEADRLDDAAAFAMAAMRQPGASRFQLAREIGEPLFEAQKYDTAAEVWSLALEDEGPQADAVRKFGLFYLANAQAFGGDTEAGVATIREAQRIDPDTAQWFFSEAVYRSFAKQYDRAIPLLERFIETYRESGDDEELVRRAQFQLSALHTQRGETDLGAEILLAVLEEEPDNAQANNDLGYLWADAGVKLDRAESMIRKALAAEPDNAAYLDSLGWVLYRRGKYEEALSALEDAVRVAESNDRLDGVILEHLGDARAKLGRRDEAKKAYARAAELVAEETAPDEELLDRVRAKRDGTYEGDEP